MKRLAIVAMTLTLTLTLSGCWSGQAFYALSENQPVIAAGTYDVVLAREAAGYQAVDPLTSRVKIGYAKDGHFTVDDQQGGAPSDAILAKLGDSPDLYVVQTSLGASVPKIGSAMYALVRLTKDGYVLAIPRCDQKRLAAFDRAVVSGLLVGKPVCTFSNRANMEEAMLDFAKDPISWTQYRRLR
jgi:hypothetical protein